MRKSREVDNNRIFIKAPQFGMPDSLDAHAKPPNRLREIYKHYQRLDTGSLDEDSDVIQLRARPPAADKRLSPTNLLKLPIELRQVFTDFLADGNTDALEDSASHRGFQVVDLPGLFVFPSLLPQDVQLALLGRLLHRDLSNPTHLTNIHLHYNVSYPPATGSSAGSYFDVTPGSLRCTPKDPAVHKPLTTQQLLDKKLRWMTLGGQYDWTNKVYPASTPPPFPADVKHLVEGLFPMRAEAAIINLYSPGDTLSMHRDVSEECNRPLASISLGCEALFIVGLEDQDAERKPRVVTIRLRSGDALLMSGESRFAWHGVPKVLRNSCPEWMRDWPATDPDQVERYTHWKGWMAGKRINVNVRQMFA